MKHLIDLSIVLSLFILAVFNLMRLNHFVPNSMKGEYQLIADKVLDRNCQDLQLENSKGDIIFENKYDQIDIMNNGSPFDKIFTFVDFIIQLNIFGVCLMNILHKEGLSDFLAIDSVAYQTLKGYGLNKNVSLISIFVMTHIN